MGIISRLFGSKGEENNDETTANSNHEDEVETCQLCGTKGVEGDGIHYVDVGFQITGFPRHVSVACDDCYEAHDLGGDYASYCCGMMYDSGELYCARCGEPL